MIEPGFSKDGLRGGRLNHREQAVSTTRHFGLKIIVVTFRPHTMSVSAPSHIYESIISLTYPSLYCFDVHILFLLYGIIKYKYWTISGILLLVFANDPDNESLLYCVLNKWWCIQWTSLLLFFICAKCCLCPQLKGVILIHFGFFDILVNKWDTYKG